jgi:hypothetical protein
MHRCVKGLAWRDESFLKAATAGMSFIEVLVGVSLR